MAELEEALENRAIAEENYRENSENLNELNELLNQGIKDAKASENAIRSLKTLTEERDLSLEKKREAEYNIKKSIIDSIGDKGSVIDPNSVDLGDFDPKDSTPVNNKLKDMFKDIEKRLEPHTYKLAIGSTIGIIAGYIVKGIIDPQTQTAKEMVQNLNGCYQKVNTNGKIELIGPCACGFNLNSNDIDNQIGLGERSCQVPLGTKGKYDPTKPLSSQIAGANFCYQKGPEYPAEPCQIAQLACEDGISGSCQIGSCRYPSPSGNNSNNTWKGDGKGIMSYPLCVSPRDLVFYLIDLNSKAANWEPTPTPPLIYLVTSIGAILMLITIIWYVLFLIKKEKSNNK
jgi:hypothetical protein